MQTQTHILYIMCFVLLFLACLILPVICMTIKPLRERIYEEIFWEIGANMNKVNMHNAKTFFIGALKVDLFMHLMYINTFVFLCILYTSQNELQAYPYWTLFGVIVALALGNNIHGYFIMQTTAGTINSKLYFVFRLLL